MSLSTELDELTNWITKIPSIGMSVLGGDNTPTCCLDFVMIGAAKRSLSLASGMLCMVKSQNMVCSRAFLRMQIDTVSRLLAYTYVHNPEEMAKSLIRGTPIKRFKSSDGNLMTDKYLIDQMDGTNPWVRKVYNFTSGYIHFSEKQFIDSIQSVNIGNRSIDLQITKVDKNFPEFSWYEIVSCFNKLLKITEKLLLDYSDEKHKRNH